MKKSLCLAVAVLTTLSHARAGDFRPPSVPLVACDPYFSIWSPGDRLTDADTTHWTGQKRALAGLVKIDGKNYRVLGAQPAEVAPLPQTGLEVLPTRTIYTFEGDGVRLTLTFLTAALPEDLDLLSRPVTYLTWEARATDGRAHQVAVYLDATGMMAADTPDQPLKFELADASGIRAWRVGTVKQAILQRSGDDLRIDWGYFYLALAKGAKGTLTVNTASASRAMFLTDGRLPAPSTAAATVLAGVLEADCAPGKPASVWLMLAYDDLYSIQYMRKNLRPYWRRNGWEAADLLRAAAHDYPSLKPRCAAFDEELMADLRNAGGEDYARLGALAYRQCFAAGKIVADEKGRPLQFCKENHSNGCISTSDVFYPMSPQFLLFGPTLAKSFLVPFMNYAAGDRWQFPFAPHDLGTYPKANGQVYGGGESNERDQMPVEESGNLLLLMTAVAEMEGNADFAGLYWKQLEQWAGYLKEKGFDPENQLCTDDFAGHLAHNVNLSAKAICALGAFGKLCELRGDQAQAGEYSRLAHDFAQRWVREGQDGDHYRLAFDRPGTWSQKYNLVWDRVLGLNLFPAEVAREEMAYYKKVQNEYGLPLDNRETYTKLDWITWTATLTGNRGDFEALTTPVIHFINTTPDRSPLTDWYQTKTARKVGFTARPVIGGVFMRMLYEKEIWRKYTGRDRTRASGWAPLPTQPKLTWILPTARTQPAIWSYTTVQPAADWMLAGYDAGTWQKGPASFGTEGTPGAVVHTRWDTGDIWLRREVTLPGGKFSQPEFYVHHDEDVEIYVNGMRAAGESGFTTEYVPLEISPAARKLLKPGAVVTLAVHCHQTAGGQNIDVGIVDEK